MMTSGVTVVIPLSTQPHTHTHTHTHTKVPPRILSSSDTDVTVNGNVPFTLTATFESRTQDLTNVTWEKLDGSILSETQIQTSWSSVDSYDGSTSLNFSSITRADQGVYRVNIYNAHDIIPVLQKTASFTLRITSVFGEFNNQVL